MVFQHHEDIASGIAIGRSSHTTGVEIVACRGFQRLVSAWSSHSASNSAGGAASLFGVAQSTIYDAVRRGELPVIRIGRRKLLPTAALLTMVGLLSIEPHSSDAAS